MIKRFSRGGCTIFNSNDFGQSYFKNIIPTLRAEKTDVNSICLLKGDNKMKKEPELEENEREWDSEVVEEVDEIIESGKTIEEYLYTDSDGEQYGIFKLTARECGRLMGVKDSAIDKMMNVNSKTQVYKQFGNSIVVPVLMALFSQLNLKGVKPWNKLTEEEKQILVKSTMDWKKEE